MPKETAREPGVMDYDYTAAAGSRQTYLHGNLIGTTEATTSASAGSPPSAGRAVYTAFGERVYANGVGGGRYGYAGAWGYQAAGTEQCGPVGETYSCDPLEELGWLHVGERYYDPACGRFVQRDPIGIRGGANVYVYVGNRPTFLVDPSGLTFWDGNNRFHDRIAREIVDFSNRTGFQGGYIGGSWSGGHFGKYFGAQLGGGLGWRMDTGFLCYGYAGIHAGIGDTGIGANVLGVYDFETGGIHGGALIDGGSPGLNGIGGYAGGAFGGVGTSIPIRGGVNADIGIYLK